MAHGRLRLAKRRRRRNNPVGTPNVLKECQRAKEPRGHAYGLRQGPSCRCREAGAARSQHTAPAARGDAHHSSVDSTRAFGATLRQAWIRALLTVASSAGNRLLAGPSPPSLPDVPSPSPTCPGSEGGQGAVTPIRISHSPAGDVITTVPPFGRQPRAEPPSLASQ
jgi:hypothetical protein